MRNNNKTSANENLAIEQFPALNKEFYSNFMDDYYFIKLESLLNILTHTSEYRRNIKSRDIELGKMKCTLGNTQDEQLKKYAKLELTTTYFHCLETFIRLFIAHATLPSCPWLEMSSLTIRDYRLKLKSLSKGNFSGFNNKFDDDITILFVLTGHTKLPEEMKREDLLGLKNWIIWAANELLNNYEYNSFKHGLAIYTNIDGFKLMDKKIAKLQKHGDCLQFLSIKEKRNRYVWTKKTNFIPYDSRSAIIFTFSYLIKNILNIGKFLYAEGEYEMDWLPNHEFSPEFIFNTDEYAPPGVPIIVKGFSTELLYYKNKSNI